MNQPVLKENGQTNVKRETFSSGLAVFFATLGSAVGLGNIWKFPYLTGKFGGGAFLLVYLICTLFIGIPIMLCEFYLGRSTRKNAVGAFRKLSSRLPWNNIGLAGVVCAMIIMFYYSSVAGWVYSYVFKALTGGLTSLTTNGSKEQFAQTIVGPVAPVVWQIIVMTVVSVILIAGVKNGIEKITKTLMPVLFILIIICCIRALTLPGAWDGLNFLFAVDFKKLTAPVILTALGLAFFKLALGVGSLLTYGSYFTEDTNMVTTSVKVALSDLTVSLLAGIAIFPAVFSFNVEPGAGPGLLFVTIPLVFSKIPFGNILLAAFFLLTSIAATTAMLSLVEVPVAYLVEEKKFSRKKAVLSTSITIVAVGVLATLSVDSSSLLGGVKFFGKGFFDLFDYVSSNILMPITGLLVALFVGYFIKKDEVKRELTNNGKLNIGGMIDVFSFVLRYVTPVLVILVFLTSIGVIKV